MNENIDLFGIRQQLSRLFTLFNSSSNVLTIVTSPAPTPSSLYNKFEITALAENAAFVAPTGTPTYPKPLVIRIKDDGTPRVLSWDSIYRAVGVTLPLITVANKILYVGMFYNVTDSKYDVTAVGQQA